MFDDDSPRPTRRPATRALAFAADIGLRQDRGQKAGFWTPRGDRTGYPSQLKFVDNRLTGFEGSGGKLNLDD